MRAKWLEVKLNKLASLQGYQKPEYLPNAVKLDSNENYVIPKQFQNYSLLLSCHGDLREYPTNDMSLLIEEISKFVKMPSSMIGVGNGSDQILDMILAHFASKNTKILVSEPTFSFFTERCKLYSIPTIKIPFSDKMTLNIDQFIKQVDNADILYLDSPNNPTGFQFLKTDLQKLVKSFNGLIILDEAYTEFANYSLLSMAKTMNNLVIVQTLSKSFGLAGLRLGYIVANEQFTNIFMNKLQYPYPLSTLTINMGIESLNQSSVIKSHAKLIKRERRRIIKTLKKYTSFDVFDSSANFVLFDAHGSYQRIYSALAEQGILIKKLGKLTVNHDGCLRVTVGTGEMNSKFLLAIRDLLK